MATDCDVCACVCVWERTETRVPWVPVRIHTYTGTAGPSGSPQQPLVGGLLQREVCAAGDLDDIWTVG